MLEMGRMVAESVMSTLLGKTLMSTNPIESMFSMVLHSERSIKRAGGSRMLQRGGLGTALLACEGRYRREKGYAQIAQVR
jgi:hypothetical protein